MKSSAVRTARTMRRSAAPSLAKGCVVARSAWRMFGCVICVACVAAAAKGGDQLYSRQLLTFGRGAQEKIMAGRVLVFGADGVGAEVCKNLALAGVASITVAGDARAPRAAADLGAHFYASRAPARSRAAATAAGAAELSSRCAVVARRRPRARRGPII